MKKVIDNGHAELAPPLKKDEECWYLPIFGVYHPKKPDQIRGVFDSSAKFNDVSLNSVLMSGPDLTNSLLEYCFVLEAIQLLLLSTLSKCFMVSWSGRITGIFLVSMV